MLEIRYRPETKSIHAFGHVLRVMYIGTYISLQRVGDGASFGTLRTAILFPAAAENLIA